MNGVIKYITGLDLTDVAFIGAALAVIAAVLGFTQNSKTKAKAKADAEKAKADAIKEALDAEKVKAQKVDKATKKADEVAVAKAEADKNDITPVVSDIEDIRKTEEKDKKELSDAVKARAKAQVKRVKEKVK